MKVEILSLQNRSTDLMCKLKYDRIASFIHTTLEGQEHQRIKINQLLDIARTELDSEFNGNVSWYILRVKNDMVVRGQIDMVFTYNREQIIVKKRSKKNLKYLRSKSSTSNGSLHYF